MLNCELLDACGARLSLSRAFINIWFTYWLVPCYCRDKWIEKVKRCEYLAEDELKSLCEYVSELLEGSSMLHMCFTHLLHGCRSRRSWLRSLMYSQFMGLSQ